MNLFFYLKIVFVVLPFFLMEKSFFRKKKKKKEFSREMRKRNFFFDVSRNVNLTRKEILESGRKNETHE